MASILNSDTFKTTLPLRLRIVAELQFSPNESKQQIDQFHTFLNSKSYSKIFKLNILRYYSPLLTPGSDMMFDKWSNSSSIDWISQIKSCTYMSVHLENFSFVQSANADFTFCLIAWRDWFSGKLMTHLIFMIHDDSSSSYQIYSQTWLRCVFLFEIN